MLNKHKIPILIKNAIRFVLPVVIILLGVGSVISSPSTYISPLNSACSEISKKATAINGGKAPIINSIFTFLESTKTASKASLQESFETSINSFTDQMQSKKTASTDIQIIKLVFVNLNWAYNFLFWLLLLLVIYDSFYYSVGKNAFVNKLISNLFKIVRNTVFTAIGIFGFFALLYYGLGQNVIFTRLYKSSELSGYLIYPIFGVLQSLFALVVYILVILFGIWLTLFVLRYFRVFENNSMQNILINRFIHKRGYSTKPQTIRQKIMELRKVQQYNSKYNSNYNNFTKYNTSLPTNKDFAFDYLSIEESNNKSKLATIIAHHKGDKI
jgi:hypothetical protein